MIDFCLIFGPQYFRSLSGVSSNVLHASEEGNAATFLYRAQQQPWSLFGQDVERRLYEGEDPLYFRTPTLLAVPTRKLVHEFESFGSGVGTYSMRRYL